jgi:hypothetical protein
VPPHDTNCSIGTAALRSDTEQRRTLLLLLLPVLAGLLLLLGAALRTHDENGDDDDDDGALWLSPEKPPSSSQHSSPPHDEPGSPSDAEGQVHTDELEEEQEENAASGMLSTVYARRWPRRPSEGGGCSAALSPSWPRVLAPRRSCAADAKAVRKSLVRQLLAVVDDQVLLATTVYGCGRR